MHRYYEDYGDVKFVVEFDVLNSPNIALGDVSIIVMDPILKRKARQAEKQKIPFEFRVGKTKEDSKLDVHVADYWKEEYWANPVLNKLIYVVLRALDSVGIVPRVSAI